MISNLLKKKKPFPFQFDCCNIFCFRFMATRTRGRNQKKYWKETVIMIKWTAFHEYCNGSLWSSFTLILHNRKRTEKGGGEKLEQVFLFCFCFCVADYRRYNLYFIVCSNLQCLKHFYQEYSQKNNLFLELIILNKTKAPFQTPQKLGCSGRICSSCSTFGTRHVTRLKVSTRERIKIRTKEMY